MDKTLEDINFDQDFGTRAIHAGQSPKQWPHGAVIPPICVSTTFYQPAPAEPLLGYDYSRAGNPTRTCLETCLASLEKAKYGELNYKSSLVLNGVLSTALTYSSGLATTMTIVQGLLSTGQQVISCDDCYGGTGRYFRHCAAQLGIETVFVDGRQADNFISAVKKGVTKLIWIETPTNPTLRLSDIQAVVDGVKSIDKDIIIVVDNTFMSSYLQQPLDHGADIVMHSLTKYMNGHTDVVMGALMTNNEKFYDRLRFMQKSLGAVPSAFDCFLVNRGLKTLHLRMEKHSQNGMEIAQFLEEHPSVRKVAYPGLPSHPQHELAKKQFTKGFGGMITFHLKKVGLEATKAFLAGLKIITLAESLGGIESLVEVPALMTHCSHPPDVLESLEIDVSLIRLSVGIESAKDLIDDLRSAFNLIK